MFLNNKKFGLSLIKLFYSSKVKQDIINCFKSNNQKVILNKFPKSFQKVLTKKNLNALYVADEIAADTIITSIERFIRNDSTFFEINPGPCILTEHLLPRLQGNKLYLIESNKEFDKHQEEFMSLHQKFELLKLGGFTQLCKPKTVEFILPLIEKRLWHEKIVGQIFLFLPNADVIDQLIWDVVLQANIFSKGRIEFFALIPPPEYKRLMSNPESGFKIYTNKSCMFQLFFDCDVLNNISKQHFMPWWYPKGVNSQKNIDDKEADILYLTKITPRADFFSYCPKNDLLPLKFFVYQCFFKRRGYIIPKFEQWAPGIGAELLTFGPDYFTGIMDKINNIEKSSFSVNMFTQFGMLTPHQLLILFHFFKNSSKYRTSAFYRLLKEKYPNETFTCLSK